jgi:hypothetical protein
MTIEKEETKIPDFVCLYCPTHKINGSQPCVLKTAVSVCPYIDGVVIAEHVVDLREKAD